MRRRKLLVLLAVAITVLAPAALLVPHKATTLAASRITSANYNRICVGMNQTEVRAILGPPGRTNVLRKPEWKLWAVLGPQERLAVRGEEDPEEKSPPLLVTELWGTPALDVTVTYDERERVILKTNTVKPMNEPSLLDLLKRQWQKWFPE